VEYCRPQLYTAVTPEDKMVSKAGWFLFQKSTSRGGISIVIGGAASDSMCRPLGFQDFVFVDGVYAGTLSPIAMNAREDGEGLYDVSIPEERKIAVDFRRFAERDPLCCPSRVTRVEYEIREENGKPVVFATSAKTHASR
jgi:hypothetical protein